jgi:hypothetical protein
MVVVLLKLARRHGRMTPRGVEVSVSHRVLDPGRDNVSQDGRTYSRALYVASERGVWLWQKERYPGAFAAPRGIQKGARKTSPL